jgi:hypothetical protein
VGVSAQHLDDYLRNDSEAWSFVTDVQALAHERGGLQRRMERAGEVPACWELLGLSVFTPSDSFALMQRHYGEGSYMVVDFSMWWRLPTSLFVFSVGSR